MAIVRTGTKKSLEELARLMSLPPSDLASTNLSHGFKSAGIPSRFVSASSDSNILMISGEEHREFTRALAWLSGEPLTEHLERREIETMLWDMCCEVFVERTRYQREAARKDCVRAFITTATKAWESFDCAFSIAELVLTCPSMTLAAVEFTQWDDVPPHWQITGHDELTTDMKGQCVAIVSASGGDMAQATERARAAVDRVLDALRLGVTQSIYIRVSDTELLFRRSEFELVRKTGTKGADRFGWNYSGRPSATTINESRAAAITTYLAPLLDPDRELASCFRERIALATRWIGASAVKPDSDDKVVALCTAIEALLSSKSDRLKGEIITMRSMLLPAAMGEGFINPFPLYVLYKRRSDIIHGTKLGVCGDEDYRSLHFQAGLILKHMLAYLALHRDMRRFEDLVSRIETVDGLKHVISWFAPYGKYAGDIVKAAQERVNRLERPLLN